MSLLIDNLCKCIQFETVGEILYELEHCGTDVDWDAPNIDAAIMWADTVQGDDLWDNVYSLYKRRSDIYVDIYSL